MLFILTQFPCFLKVKSEAHFLLVKEAPKATAYRGFLLSIFGEIRGLFRSALRLFGAAHRVVSSRQENTESRPETRGRPLSLILSLFPHLCHYVKEAACVNLEEGVHQESDCISILILGLQLSVKTYEK